MATVFLDYDGTLHDCMRLYGPAFRAAYASLVEQGYCEPREFEDAWIAKWLGWTIRDMWETFQPELPEEVWRPASHLVGVEMNRLLDEGAGALFEGIPEALTQLKEEGYTIVFLSNCARSYRDRHAAAFGLDAWIDAYHCAGDFPGLEKWEIYQQVAERYPKPHVMVGDRFHDIEVATRAGIPSIGCTWGYGAGELDTATILARRPADLPTAVRAALRTVS